MFPEMEMSIDFDEFLCGNFIGNVGFHRNFGGGSRD